MKDWHLTQNEEYLKLLINRLKEPKLEWVKQFVEIINNLLDKEDNISINDIGCNVGHFFRGVEDIKCQVDYRGYDISEIYLDIAKEHFSKQKFNILDISKETPEEADISIISATLEHIQDSDSAVSNIFTSTKKFVLLRTFLGEIELCDMCTKKDSKNSYVIKQFVLKRMINNLKNDWDYIQFDDKATNGISKDVCETTQIIRKQKIILFIKKVKDKWN